MRYSTLASFVIPGFVAAAALFWIWGTLGLAAFTTALLLVVLEVTLSFDNAVVNAGVLKHMTPKWQWRFLTWGILIAVFGARALLPILIVSLSAFVSPFAIAWVAISDPKHYGELLENAHYVISAFGGMFLLMVSFKYFFNRHKKLHWLQLIEKRLSMWGSIEAIEVILSIIILLMLGLILPEHRAEVLSAGLVGIVLFIVIQSIISSFSIKKGMAGASGLILFLYLNVLDTAFSLDGVVGAFALSTNIVVIAVGLGIGAYFVRSMTLYLVHHGTLDELIYIEHGAHWAILGLALAMLAAMFVTVPEPVTGFVGFAFLGLAYLSSLRARRSRQ